MSLFKGGSKDFFNKRVSPDYNNNSNRKQINNNLKIACPSLQGLKEITYIID